MSVREDYFKEVVMAAIIYMRFRQTHDDDTMFYVGTSRESMREDALGMGVLSGFEDGEDVSSEIVVAEAKSRVVRNVDNPSAIEILDKAVAAARSGVKSFYLFG